MHFSWKLVSDVRAGYAHWRECLRNSSPKFKPPADCVRAAQEFMAHANPLLAFIEDETVSDPNGHVLLRNFREAMTQWATGQGMKKPVPNKTLKRQLEGLGYEVKKVEGHNRVNGLASLCRR